MAREPELSIKVKVDPQIKPTELKTSIERKVKQSGEKPQIDIDPNVDGIKGKIEDKLKNIKATANITPVVDTEKLKTDIQQQINGIGDIPKVTVGVNVDDFSSELTKQLKDQLKEVNQQLSYYLKNLTSNTDRLGSFANDIFPTKELKTSAKQVANEVSDEFVGGLSGTFNINDLLNYKISDTTKKRNLSQVENLVNEIKDIWAGLYADNWLDDDKININAFNDQFTQLGSKAKELKSILDSVYSAFDSDKFKDKLDVFNAQGFDLNKKLKEFMSIDDFLDEIIDKSKDAFKTTDQAMDFSKLINGLTGDNKISFNSVLDNVSGELGNVHAKISEINSSAKAVKTEIKDVQKEANAAQKTDTSGHLDASTIETYGQKLDKVLSNIADKQNAINNARKTAVDLEKNILAATVLTREGLSNELTQYEALFKKFDTDKIAKFAETTNLAEFIKNQEIKMQDAQNSGEKNQIEDGVYNVKDVKFDIDPAVLQLKVDEAFKDISAPIDLHLKKDAAKRVKDELNKSLNESDKPDIPKNDNQSNVNDVVPIPGKVTITDADIVVDVKNPVSIPGTVTVDPTSVQLGNSDDLQKNVDALLSVKQSLKGISTNAEGYGTKIAAIGPSVQYVAQEVDNLSKSLENQITDLDLIAKKTDAYGTTANSVTLNTKDVAAPTAPVDIPGKVTLKVEDVTPPKGSVKIPGKVELKVSDITPPKTAIELEGKVSNVTVDDTAKGKKKNTKDDIKKPEVIDLKGKVELKDEDIKRPNPLNLNGAVKIKAADVKIDDVEISKKEFDIKGNLILKNAEIVNAVKEAVGEAAKVKKKNKPVENSGGESEEKSSDFDCKAKEAHLGWLISNIGENRTYLQSAISNKDSNKRSWYAGKIADYEKDFEETTRELIENLTEEEQDWIKSLKGIKDLDLNDPKQIDELMADKTISWPWEESGSYLNGTLKAANMAGFYNVSETDKAKKRNSYEKEYVELIKQKPALIKAAAEAKKQYGEDSDAYKDAVKAKKENEESLRAIKADRQKAGVPRGIVGGGYSNSPAVQSTLADIHKQVQKRRSELLLQKAKDSKSADDKQAQQAKKILSDAFIEQVRAYANGLKESAKYNDDAASESAKTARQQMQDAFDSANDKFLDLLDVLSGDEINQLTLKAKKELDSANIIVERRTSKRIDNNNKLQDNRYQNLIDNLSNKQKTYGTVEEAVAEGKTATDIQVALQKQQELVDKIAKAKVGTEEYNNAIQAAEENWKSVVAIIDTVEKKQKDLTKAVDSIEKKFYQLAEEASGSSNEKLKNSINGVITKAAALSAKNPNTYENYAVDYNELKRESYKANAQYTIWKSNYKKLEREGIKIAEGVEVARQMQTDGSLQNVKFDSIDNLLRQLNELEPQTDAYKEKLVEVKKIWEEIERKVKAVEEAENQAAKRESTKISNLKSVSDAISQNRATMKDVQKNYGTDYSFYGKLQEKDSKLKTLLDTINESSDPVSAAKGWAQNNLGISPDKINSVTDAINQLHLAYREATQEAKDFNKEASREKSINKASMEVANLKATIHDYIAEHKKLDGTDVGKSLYELLEALNQSDAPEKIGELKKKYAELRAESKKLGLESKNLLDVFEKLFGQHLSTMITMAALHKMQDALRIVYQNVVEIDTAVTELRKVSEYTGKSLEEYMGRAAEQAQKLGVSISDYVNSTADWKRLGYSDEDAENLATYSTLLRNVGDNIDDVNTSSSYLISTLQGFGLLADQAEDVVNKIDAVANTQPVTAKDLGEILTRSSAAMSAANNTLEETIALGTAANAVIQDADTVGTTLKSLSMYLRAAKSDAENAGIEVDGMANSVSELRSELKSLTGVDIMLDSKNFKSTYQIMKELSQVWSGLSDVTQANVTEMIGGKRNANAVSAILNNFDVAESAMESAANSANVAWEENEKYLDSINGRLAQLDASFQVLSQDVLSSGLVKGGVSFLTSIVKLLDKIINLTGALPAGLGIAAFATQLGKPKMTGFMIVPSNTPGGDTEQVLRRYFIISLRSMREYLVKPTNMVA
jgi:TP901 family phage tail tape measure protein